mmetsp:Transcript_29377/g.57234  ORF Transcript_29377/g.57234 Transcript_29377/m.57234 type:complete len:367 (+) Transcript_29377:2-1102(+)
MSMAYVSLMKATVFKLYVAGERLEDCRKVASKTERFGMKIIVDHSTEEKETPDAWASNLTAKDRLFKSIAKVLGTSTVGFVPIKITALASPHLLEKMTASITSKADWEHSQVDPLPSLSPDEKDLADAALHNLNAICEMAKDAGISVLLDAEQSNRQPAIEYLANRVMAQHNTCAGSPPVVYNTFQMYLKGSIDRLRRDVRRANDNGYHLAVKLVRGAYMVTESARAEKLGIEDPVMPSKESTDQQYNDAIQFLLEQKSQGFGISTIIATHNRQSILYAIEQMDALGIAKDDPSINFAQILGLCDNLGHALGDAGYNANKLVLFGDFEEVFPWLLRRLDENQDALGATVAEADLLMSEIRRRCFGS